MRYINKKMVIIGFVVTVMIFSSFAIVFSNSGNNLKIINSYIKCERGDLY